MKDGQYFTYTRPPNMFVSVSRDAGSFSCYRSHGDHKHVSSSVCECQTIHCLIHTCIYLNKCVCFACESLSLSGVSQSGCWDVTYTSRRVCALVGSTVDISSTYSHPSDHTVNKTFWHYVPSGGFKDLREEHQFAGRVEYVGNKLRIKDLKISDSGEYRFRIITDLNGRFSGSPGVILTVTGN